ncbi:hypothetical protein C8Q69DRAFT_470583 [Paecilomyces variotii]|uniref:Transmembrane protein n=1 Tax=Byssochlamys spectabilis TaxID=264951 RepID=A0A443HS00_BYSSP|nr:hypothetical protein C8Q69DRAFT_470583 [Paecilomyces variotii]KAJ9304319.1 hypothetical protein DTO217A2_6165 [Paecilomyces variotii]KAJ9365480.1 hypothetical protein DTO280E4_449 [Paecilomyces variotii]RWQ94549.1 hypothetical protein C8Q69DRAFT_470583 [Paecilomyces variotii]
MSLPLGLSLSSISCFLLLLCLQLPRGVAADKAQHAAIGGGYKYGQTIPVTCLNRTIDSGEHITDNLGKLQYIPFHICSETKQPLALRYGVSETVSCTIDSLSDTFYHLLEYYVHSDAPLTCRVPTAPLNPSTGHGADDQEDDEKRRKDAQSVDVLDNDGPSYTPLTVALQGTLQKSHLHIWTDMNVLAHKISSIIAPSRKEVRTAPGYVVAGTAYSVPEFDVQVDQKKASKEARAAALIENARDPWSAGHGTKVVRGEPLTFRFHVSWAEGGEGIGWTLLSASNVSSSSDGGNLFVKMFFFVMAVSVGALGALYWERSMGRGRQGWKGDGILGRPTSHPRNPSGVVYGDGGRSNGYGGYGLGIANGTGTSGAGYGYGGFTSGKKD